MMLFSSKGHESTEKFGLNNKIDDNIILPCGFNFVSGKLVDKQDLPLPKVRLSSLIF